MCRACSSALSTAARFSRAAFSEPGTFSTSVCPPGSGDCTGKHRPRRRLQSLDPHGDGNGADGRAAGIGPGPGSAGIADGKNDCLIGHEEIPPVSFFLSYNIFLEREAADSGRIQSAPTKNNANRHAKMGFIVDTCGFLRYNKVKSIQTNTIPFLLDDFPQGKNSERNGIYENQSSSNPWQNGSASGGN